MVSAQKLRSHVKTIRAFCEANRDEENVKKYARFFTEGFDAYGVSNELFIEYRNQFLQENQSKLPLDDCLKLGDLLLESGKYEEASFAIRFVDAYQDDYTTDTFHKFGDWLDHGIRNWGHTDVLCGEVLSVFLTSGLITYDVMADWLNSPSKWKRRAVPVTMLCLLKTKQKIKPLLEFIEPLMEDDDRFVHQGTGWFLREAWKLYPKPVETFLLKWKDTAPRKIYQYATEKMSKEDRKRFRKQKT